RAGPSVPYLRGRGVYGRRVEARWRVGTADRQGRVFDARGKGLWQPMTRPLNALVVSYAFPPVGGAGVQRVTKLVKYLPSYGVTPAVLTVRNPSVPLRDESLERDVPAG